MLEKYCCKLELNKIIDMLKEYCTTEVGINLINNMQPTSNKLIVKHLLSETTQAKNLIAEKGNLPLSNLPDYSKILKMSESNYTLSCANLLSIAQILKSSKNLKNYFLSAEDSSKYDNISDYFNSLYLNIDLENLKEIQLPDLYTTNEKFEKVFFEKAFFPKLYAGKNML